MREEVRLRQELYGVDGRQEAVLRYRAETTEGKTESGESMMNDMNFPRFQPERCMHTVFRLFFHYFCHGGSYTPTEHTVRKGLTAHVTAVEATFLLIKNLQEVPIVADRMSIDSVFIVCSCLL